ncbi:MAG: hypothetical protein K2N61_11085 [Lachnospiraceae bacterium]|nr:hypothetical protein [Lachnospiraceae bacterium]
MAKKRDHKIIITDEAIAKVPYIRYQEIPEKEYSILQGFAKEILIISKEQNNSNEVALTYSLESEDLIAKGKDYIGISLGNEHSVDPLAHPTAYHLVNSTSDCVIVLLHNHPSLSKISLADIQFFLFYDTVKMMVIVTNLGSISYIIKSSKYNREEAIRIAKEAVEMEGKAKNLKGYQEAVKYFLKNCHRTGIIYEDR